MTTKPRRRVSCNHRTASVKLPMCTIAALVTHVRDLFVFLAFCGGSLIATYGRPWPFSARCDGEMGEPGYTPLRCPRIPGCSAPESHRHHKVAASNFGFTAA